MDMEILRAVFLKNNTKTFSSQEFQELLNLWFHEKGVLTELRLHLRFRLIHILKNTAIGRDINEDNLQSSSLSHQAFNLIVAEYLMQNKCYYSLSMFNTEATFANVLFTNPVNFGGEKQNECYSVYFDKENISKILDLLGVTQNNPYYEKLLCMYFNMQENKSILSCLTTLLCQSPKLVAEVNDANLSKVVQAMLIDNTSKMKFMKKIEELLSYTNLPSCYVKEVSQNINSFYEMKRREQKKELLDVINQLKGEIVLKDMSIKKLQKSKNILEGQLLNVNKHYDNAKIHLENVLREENFMHQERLLGQRKLKYDQPEDNLRQNNLESPKQDKICHLTHCNNVCRENAKLVEDVLNENTILRNENKKQKDVLQKLFIIYKDLLSKFGNFQLKRNLIKSTVGEEFAEELHNYLNEHNLEDELHHNIFDVKEIERENITEDILHETRTKLQTLEDETKEIEDKFKSFSYN